MGLSINVYNGESVTALLKMMQNESYDQFFARADSELRAKCKNARAMSISCSSDDLPIDWYARIPWDMLGAKMVELNGVILCETGGVFNFPSWASFMYIKKCRVTAFPISFGDGFNSITHLRLNGMGLVNLGEQVVFPVGLVQLSLEDNLLSDLSNVTWPEGLTLLNLIHNRIQEFKIGDNLPPNLYSLHLNENLIKKLEISFTKRHPLNYLTASENKITHVDIRNKNCTISMLYIMKNPITSIKCCNYTAPIKLSDACDYSKWDARKVGYCKEHVVQYACTTVYDADIWIWMREEDEFEPCPQQGNCKCTREYRDSRDAVIEMFVRGNKLPFDLIRYAVGYL